MTAQTRDVALRGTEVPMVEPETVRQMRELRRLGWGKRRIACEVGVSIGTVLRYLRRGEAAETQVRPTARCLDDDERAVAVTLLETTAQGNAVVVAQLLAERGVEASVRTVQRAVSAQRQARRAAEAATVRFETAPGHQTQIDFGEKRVAIGGQLVKVFFFVAVLGYSRRIFAKAFLRQRQDDWREGLIGAFRCFGGVTQTLLIDNAGAMVIGRDEATQTARLHPAFAAYCRELGVAVRACQPYRARTKGKTESGVGYVKRNAIAGREFASFSALEAHLATWCQQADEREHGTTHEVPRVRYERGEAASLKPLPALPPPPRERRLERRVATDCFVDVDTVRYSVPYRLVRERVEVLVAEGDVRIFHDGKVVAVHRRSNEPHARIVEPEHLQGLWRVSTAPAAAEATPTSQSPLEAMGRSLRDYEALVDGGGR
jgi:transposase